MSIHLILWENIECTISFDVLGWLLREPVFKLTFKNIASVIQRWAPRHYYVVHLFWWWTMYKIIHLYTFPTILKSNILQQTRTTNHYWTNWFTIIHWWWCWRKFSTYSRCLRSIEWKRQQHTISFYRHRQ